MSRQSGNGQRAIDERRSLRRRTGEMKNHVAEKVLRLEMTQLSGQLSDRGRRQGESGVVGGVGGVGSVDGVGSVGGGGSRVGRGWCCIG